MNPEDPLLNSAGFEWDEDNVVKNWEKHRVSFWECEEVFFNQPFVLAGDTEHSEQEKRYYALGKTDADRYLFVAFTQRHKQIRVISARDMNSKERSEYRNAEKKDT
jgi:uncharacterized protein